MSNVIYVSFPTPEERRAATLGTLLRDFATARRSQTDVFWLKENGELLNILESTGASVPDRFLDVHRGTYDQIGDRLAFFPQYYRFILSIGLDLEALGLDGEMAERMCDWVINQKLIEGETSDIQRLEAKRLLARRNRPAPADDGLEDRLRVFASHPDRFALPNKKAAYELTHIVFYLSEYGRKDPNIGQSAIRSLENVGIWAFLDGNADLLSEICIAMRYAGREPSRIWENWIADRMSDVTITRSPGGCPQDSYHAVLMGAWLDETRGGRGLAGLAVPEGTEAPALHMPRTNGGALREMSRQLFALGGGRSSDWEAMRPRISEQLSADARELISHAETASDSFAAFFESFARTVMVGRA